MGSTSTDRDAETKRLDKLEASLNELSGKISTLNTSFAVQEAMLKNVSEDVKEAREQWTKTAAELGSYGIQLSKYTHEIASLKDALLKIDPVVQSLQSDRTMVLGATKAAGVAVGPIKTILWAIAAGLAFAGTFIAGLLASFRNPPHP